MSIIFTPAAGPPKWRSISMNWKFWSKEDKNPQDWKPHWAIKTLYTAWRILFAGFKIALGAAATVLLVGVVCLFVFATTLGDYLEEDIVGRDRNEYDDDRPEYVSYGPYEYLEIDE